MRIRGRLKTFEPGETIVFDDKLTSGNAKVIANILRKHGYVRQDWDDLKMALMAELLMQKFSYTGLANKLLSTGGEVPGRGRCME